MGLNRKKLKEWVHRKLMAVEPSEAFTLWHVGQHALQLVAHLSSAERNSDAVVDDIEQQVVYEASGHIEAWPGRQQYLLKANDRDGEEMGEYPFSLNGRQALSPGEALAEPLPELEHLAGGRVGPEFSHPAALFMLQGMRHNEALTKMVIEMGGRSHERDGRIIAAQQRTIEYLEKEKREFFDLHEEMRCRRHERELKQQEHEADAQRKDRLLGSLQTLVLPPLAAKLGAALSVDSPVPLPAAVSPPDGSAEAHAANDERTEEDPSEKDDLQAIATIFMSLPADKQAEIMDSLSAENQQRLLEIIQRAGARAAGVETAPPKAKAS